MQGSDQSNHYIIWGAQAIRSTIFAPVVGRRVDDLFESAFLRKPDFFQASAPNAGGVGNATASLPSGLASLNLNPGRIDLTLGPNVSGQPQFTNTFRDHNVLRDVDAGLATIIEATIASAKAFVGAISRVAIGLDLVEPAETVEEANQILNTILPYGIKLSDERDFMLQRNDLTQFNDKITLNSMSRWGVLTVQQMNITAGPQLLMPTSASVINSYFLAQKFCDVNTRHPLKNVDESTISALLAALKARVETLRRISG